MALADHVDEICRSQRHEREMRIAVLAALRESIPFDAHAWLLTDPVTCVGSSPVADVPVLGDLPRVIAAKYRSSVNRWTELVDGRAATWTSDGVVDARNADSWCVLLGGYGIADVASIVIRDAFGCWAFLDLWRRGDPFTDIERDGLGAIASQLAGPLRQAQLRTFESSSAATFDGPAVLLLADDLALVGQTEAGAHYSRALLPPDPGRSAIPAAAFNVAAQLLAIEAGVDVHPPSARVHIPERSWMTCSAARVAAPGTDAPTIAVSIEPTPPVDRASLFARLAGLTPRESDVLDAIVAGNDSRHAATALSISEHTLQDHLKSIFAKTGADSRRALVARVTGA